MYRSVFARDVFAEMDRLQRDMQQAFDLSPTICGLGRSGFPALNVGGTPQAIEVYAFAPGLDPDALEVHLERGLLTLAGVRNSPLFNGNGNGNAGGSSQENAAYYGATPRIGSTPAHCSSMKLTLRFNIPATQTIERNDHGKQPEPFCFWQQARKKHG